MRPALVALVSAYLVATATAAGEPPEDALVAVPRPDVTPGATRAGDAVLVCTQRTAEFRRRGAVSRAQIRDAYNEVPRGGGFVYDHLVPLAIGDANVTANLWPQPRGQARRKDRCEALVRRKVCSTGELSLEAAQRGFADDWVNFCSRLGAAP